jgi:hypothetical protein
LKCKAEQENHERSLLKGIEPIDSQMLKVITKRKGHIGGKDHRVVPGEALCPIQRNKAESQQNRSTFFCNLAS